MRKRPTPAHCPLKDEHEEYKKKGIEKCFVCHLKVGPSYMERVRVQVDAIPREVKQKLLDALREHNVWDSIKLADPGGLYHHTAMFQAIADNIERNEYSTLRKTPI